MPEEFKQRLLSDMYILWIALFKSVLKMYSIKDKEYIFLKEGFEIMIVHIKI